MTDLSRKRERDRFAVRREPYWHKLDEGAHLGFRRGPDTWIARYRGRDKQRHYSALEVPLDASDAFMAAKRLAEGWLARMGNTAVRSVQRGTVRVALDAYLADLRRHGRHEAADEAKWRYRATLYQVDEQPDEERDDPLAYVQLEAATQDDFLDWRDRLAEGRQARTVNRYVRAVVAGLNRSLQLGHVGNPLAWSLQALADDVEDEGETAVFLTRPQRAAFTAAATPECAAFLRGLELTGARPKELAEANVADFDGESLRLAHKKGRPPKLRVRRTMLSAEGVTFFEQQIRDKLPAAPIFTEDGEQRWRRHMWARRVRTALAAHNKTAKGKERIPPEASAYSFRHSRISELLQLHGIDPLTVANQTGTSLAVIEKTYYTFIPSAMREKLAAVKESA